MNMQFRPGEQKGTERRRQAGHRRLRHPSAAQGPEGPLPVSREALARSPRCLRRARLSGHGGRPALSEGPAERVAPRCGAAGRRRAGLVAEVHAAAAPRSEQCLARHPVPAVAAGLPQPRSRRRTRARDQRLAGRRVVEPGQAPARVRGRLERGRRRLGEGNPQPRRRQEFRAGAADEPQHSSRSVSAATGRSTRRRKRPACRSASTRSATAVTRSRPAAGRATTSRRWSATRSASSRRWRAWCWKACSSASRN